MVQFYPLTVTHIRKTTRDAVVVTLKPDDPGKFAFTQGQYLTFRRTFEGQELRRSYSICSAPGTALQVGIKRVKGGAFSTWANQELAVGDVLEAMAPMGNFHASSEDEHGRYLAFAAGSGITPILSILRTGLSNAPRARFTLVYANRNPNSIMFREELEDLKNANMGRFNVIHILSDDSQDIDLFQGRIDADKCRALFANWIDLSGVGMVYVCGPEPLMKTISTALEQHGVAKDRIRYELFASAQSGRLPKPVSSSETSTKGVTGRVTIGGEKRSLTIHPGTSLLEAALAANVEAPYACKAGVCSTCKAKLNAGDVEMVSNHALEDYEVEAGYILTCQSHPVGHGVVAWDYDEAGH